MMCRLAVALLAMLLAVPAFGPLPAFGQHAASRGGFSGHGGFAGHSGFASHSGFAGYSGRAGISRPAAPFHGGPFGSPAFRPLTPVRSGYRPPYFGRGFAAGRPAYRPGYANHYSGPGHDHDHHGGHGHWYVTSYGYAYSYGYPGWYGYPYLYSYVPYPYVIDPGFYDWGVPDDSGDNPMGYGYVPDNGDSSYGNPVPYADYGSDSGVPNDNYYTQAPSAITMMPRQPYGAYAIPAAPREEEPLTVIFKDGRAPEQMQNYILSASFLTDLDQNRYHQIPLDQIDLAATEQANRTRGINFQVPGTSRN